MLIADSQVHLWRTDDPEGKPRHGDRPYGVSDALAEMRAANVTRAVLIPPYWVGFDNRYCCDAAARHPEQFRVMGRFDVTVRDEDAVASWLRQPEMLGIRLTLHTPELRPFVAGDAADWFWAAAEKAAIPVMVHAPGELAGIARIARDFPKLRLAIDHMGIGRGGKDEDAFAHMDTLLKLAAHSNICVKLTTLPIYSSEPYPHPRLHPLIRALYGAFGPRRLFWGSDLTRLPCSYRLAVNLFTEEFKWLTASDLEWIMGRALCEWSDWQADHS
jgi:predicted TIM-barrel fold metal-dependent hydrolase